MDLDTKREIIREAQLIKNQLDAINENVGFQLFNTDYDGAYSHNKLTELLTNRVERDEQEYLDSWK